MSFGSKIVDARKNLGMTQRALADAIGVSATRLNYWEKDKRQPDVEMIKKLAHVLDVSGDYLIDNPGGDVPAGLEPLPSFRRVPIVGAIACGQPILADENVQGYADMPEHVRADFVLRCKGDSMIDARIHDGDLVYIRKQPVVENGEIAAVRIDDEVTLKRWTRQGSTVILQPANARYAPMAFSGPDLQRLHVEGKAVAFISPL